MLKKIIILNKKIGETPLEALEAFRAKTKEYVGVPMTYAGRLDPMASGVLVILAGEKAKNKEKYLNLDKEYEFEVLFGYATDTYDVLGKIQHSDILKNVGMLPQSEWEKNIKENLKNFTGKFVQSYPPYSSKTVKGKPLFEYSRNEVEVEAPTREVYVKKLDLVKVRKISAKNLLKNIEKRVGGVKGDFRQAEILKIWRENLTKSPKSIKTNFLIASCKIKCGSGTYVRGIADSLGKNMQIPALAYSIKRTKVGKYTIIK